MGQGGYIVAQSALRGCVEIVWSIIISNCLASEASRGDGGVDVAE